MPRQVIPRDSVTLQQAIDLHNKAKISGQEPPHFVDKNGQRFYVDRRGKSSGGGQYLRNLGAKLATEAARKAQKKGQTPTLEHYIEAFNGNVELATALYKNEKENLKKLYGFTDSDIYDLDHINSMASGGVHHSRNLRPQEKSQNRSEGARQLSDKAIQSLNVPGNIVDFLRLQGPQPNSELRDIIASDAQMRANNGSMTLNTILTKANMPALGGFKQDNRKPTTTATSKPEQPASKPVQQPYRPPQLPVTPVMDLAKPVMTFMGAAAAITTSLMGFDLQFK